MSVWIVIHRDYYDGDEIRGVFATKEAAEYARVTRTPRGRPSKAWGSHSRLCCEVEEHEVRE